MTSKDYYEFEKELESLTTISIGLQSVAKHLEFKSEYKFIMEQSKKIKKIEERINIKLLHLNNK